MSSREARPIRQRFFEGSPPADKENAIQYWSIKALWHVKTPSRSFITSYLCNTLAQNNNSPVDDRELTAPYVAHFGVSRLTAQHTVGRFLLNTTFQGLITHEYSALRYYLTDMGQKILPDVAKASEEFFTKHPTFDTEPFERYFSTLEAGVKVIAAAHMNTNPVNKEYILRAWKNDERPDLIENAFDRFAEKTGDAVESALKIMPDGRLQLTQAGIDFYNMLLIPTINRVKEVINSI